MTRFESGPGESGLPGKLAELRTQHGLDFAVTRRVLCLLAQGNPYSVTALVEQTGASRRWVTDTLSLLAEWLDEAGGRFMAAAPHRAALRAEADCDTALPRGFPMPGSAPEPLTAPEAPAPDQLRTLMAEAAAGLPPSLWSLDHVPATTDTAVRRAYALHANYDLAGRHVLCLGDHDLTSVALTLLSPTVTVTVADIDDLILEHIGALAQRHRLPIRTVFADFRAELPTSLLGSTDLVFTDPPYTPQGIELFLTRAITALNHTPGCRVLFCYSHNERQLGRGIEVQEVVGELQLALDGLIPGFNQFTGAESIGSQSSLWICRPTTKSWPAAERRAAGVRIYSRGKQSEETAGGPDMFGMLRRYAQDANDIVTIGTRPAAMLALETWLRSEPPLGQGGSYRRGATLLVDLTDFHGSYVYRMLARGPAVRRAVFAAPRRDLHRLGLTTQDSPVRQFLSAKYTVEVHSNDVPPDMVIVVADERSLDDISEPDRVARYLLEHPKARLAGAWREALVSFARRRGVTLSKNEARGLIAELIDPDRIDLRHLCELPHQTFVSVAEAVGHSASQITAVPAPES